MKFSFTKMQGCANDYIYLDCRTGGLPREIEALARRLGIGFVDAGQWGVEMTFDGVHFTESGHRAFAAGLREVLSCSLG